MATIERAAFGAHHDNVVATLRKLRDVYRAAGDSKAAAEIRRADASGRAQPCVAQSPLRIEARLRDGAGLLRDQSRAERRYQARGVLQQGARRTSIRLPDVTIPQVHQEAELETQPRWLE